MILGRRERLCWRNEKKGSSGCAEKGTRAWNYQRDWTLRRLSIHRPIDEGACRKIVHAFVLAPPSSLRAKGQLDTLISTTR